MKPMLSKLLLLGLLILAIQTCLARFVFKNDVPDSVQAFRKGIAEHAPTWYFGDSTILCTGWKDRDKRPLHEMVQDSLGGESVVTIARGGFQPAIYADFCDAMTRRGIHPQTVIIPVNLRSFSSGWVMNPYYQCERESVFLKHDSLLFQTMFRPLAVFKSINLHTVSQQDYEKALVWNGGRVVGTVLDFDNPSFATYSGEHFKKKLIFYYMAELREDHPYLQALGRVLDTLDPRQTRVIIYITPIDHETGEKHLGDAFRDQIVRNIETLRGFLKKHGVNPIDLSRSVGADGFEWKVEMYPNEHMNDFGRALVARRLSGELSGKAKAP